MHNRRRTSFLSSAHASPRSTDARCNTRTFSHGRSHENLIRETRTRRAHARMLDTRTRMSETLNRTGTTPISLGHAHSGVLGLLLSFFWPVSLGRICAHHWPKRLTNFLTGSITTPRRLALLALEGCATHAFHPIQGVHWPVRLTPIRDICRPPTSIVCLLTST